MKIDLGYVQFEFKRLNESLTTMVNQRSLQNLKPCKPGETHNPLGRPKGVVSYIKSKTNGIKECVDLMVDIMRGVKVKGLNKEPGLFYRMDAAKWLFDKAVGKTLLPDEDSSGYDLRRLILIELSKRKDGSDIVVQEPIDVDGQDMETK